MKELDVLNKETTMTSLQLFEMADYTKLTNLHTALKNKFPDAIKEGLGIKPTLRANGQVEFYSLNELYSKAFAAMLDTKYLLQITQYWIDKGEDSRQMTELELAKRHVKVLEEKYELIERNKALAITLDKEHGWSSIKRQEAIHNKSFKWQPLTQWHKENDIERKEVFDQNYGTVKSYNIRAWLEVYNISL